jgi:hypothetical protein
MILIKCIFLEITYILHEIHHYAVQFTNKVLFVRKVLQFTKKIGERSELVGGVTTPESWPMGNLHTAMALSWWVGWPHWPTGKLVDGGEQNRQREKFSRRGERGCVLLACWETHHLSYPYSSRLIGQ